MPNSPLVISTPLIVVNYVLAFVAFILSINFAFKIYSEQRKHKSVDFARGINYILLISFLMIFLVMVDGFFSWFNLYSFVKHGTPFSEAFNAWENNTLNPSAIDWVSFVINIGIYIMKIFSQTVIISFVLIIWFALRAYNRIIIEKLSKSN
jgi:hypothetical protein